MSRVRLDEAMLVSAVRYALGRATYIVSMTVEEAIYVWDDLSDRARETIVRDLTEWLDRVRDGRPHGLAMQCDMDDWQRLLDHTRADS